MNTKPKPPASGLRTVVLRHDLPDGSHHYDWMLDLPSVSVDGLVTFRLDQSLLLIENDSEQRLTRIADHRRRYIEYEGPVSNDRGSVQRIAAGEIKQFDMTSDCNWRLRIRWGDGLCDYRLRQRNDGWSVVCIAKTHADR